MKTETLFKKLKENGYAIDGCLRWNHIDLEEALYQAGYEEIDLASLNKEDQDLLLKNFFDHCAPYIIETIRDLMVDYLSQMYKNNETINVSQQEF